jgi:PTS system mannose-specific IIA component
MVTAILITHGLLGGELIRAAETILGKQEGLAALSNREVSLESLEERVRAVVGAGEDPVYLFVDVLGGSCCHAALLLAKRDPRIRVIAGVNLPMLLEFLHHRGRVGEAELEARILQRGREGIRRL